MANQWGGGWESSTADGTIRDQSIGQRSPLRIQRKRAKGWQMPEGAVYVGRPSRWANPFAIGQLIHPLDIDPSGKRATREQVLALYPLVAADEMRKDPTWLTDLRGRDLACWCPLDIPCHADLLLRWANA